MADLRIQTGLACRPWMTASEPLKWKALQVKTKGARPARRGRQVDSGYGSASSAEAEVRERALRLFADPCR